MSSFARTKVECEIEPGYASTTRLWVHSKYFWILLHWNESIAGIENIAHLYNRTTYYRNMSTTSIALSFYECVKLIELQSSESEASSRRQQNADRTSNSKPFQAAQLCPASTLSMSYDLMRSVRKSLPTFEAAHRMTAISLGVSIELCPSHSFSLCFHNKHLLTLSFGTYTRWMSNTKPCQAASLVLHRQVVASNLNQICWLALRNMVFAYQRLQWFVVPQYRYSSVTSVLHCWQCNRCEQKS